MKILITAGGTFESIDKVRKITNNSTGLLGKKIFEALTRVSDIHHIPLEIYYVAAHGAVLPIFSTNHPESRLFKVTDVNSVEETVTKLLKKNKIDIMIHAMAISDFSVSQVFDQQLLMEEMAEKLNHEVTLNKTITPDILSTIIQESKNATLDRNQKIRSNTSLVINLKPSQKIISKIKVISPRTRLIAFKLLNNVTEEELKCVAHQLLMDNQCDLVIANDSENITDTHHYALFLQEDKIIGRYSTKDVIAEGLALYLLKGLMAE